MKNPKYISDRPKQKRPPIDWCGLSNEPRNENLARMRGPGSFEKSEEDRDKECGSTLLFRIKKNKGKDPLGK